MYFKEHASDLCKPGTRQGEIKLHLYQMHRRVDPLIEKLAATSAEVEILNGRK